MEDDKKIIYDFLDRYEDFAQTDTQNGYAKVYRPSWHPQPLQFWFNPPYDNRGISYPTLSNAIILKNDGEIMVEDVYSGLFYNLEECLGDSVANFAYSIREQRPL